MAQIFNSFLHCSSSSVLATQLNSFRNPKLTPAGKRSAPPQLRWRYAGSPSTLQDQQYQLQEELFDEYEEKKEKMRELIELREEEDPMEMLIFVDTIQRLRLAHHYEKEIDKIMKQQYSESRNAIFFDRRSLREVALSFRLLRQRGFHISAGPFIAVLSKSHNVITECD